MILDPHTPMVRRAVGLFFDRFGRPSAGDPLARLTDLSLALSGIPYENFTKIIQLQKNGPVPRTPLRVIEQHLDLGTGGTCFALTELMCHLCVELGLAAHPVMAHMRHGQNIHCALLVRHRHREYLVDPGYQVHRPLVLCSDAVLPEQRGPSQPFVVPAGSLDPVPPGVPAGQFDLFTLQPNGPTWRYRFSVDDPGPARFFDHWRDSFFAPGLFGLFATSREPDGTLNYLHNHKLRRQHAGGRSMDNIRSDLERQVAQTFGIDPTITARAWEAVGEKRKQFQDLKRKSAGEDPHGTPG